MAYQLLLRSPTGEQRVTLDHPIVVGRDPSCDVTVDSARVSRRHAEFYPTSDGVGVRDLGSRNGILVNGTRVEEASIGQGDRILLGDVAVTVSVPGGTTAHSRVSSSPPALPGMPPASPPPAMPGPLPAVPPAPDWGQGLPAPPPAPPYGQPSWGQQAGPALTPPGADKTTILPRGSRPVPVGPGLPPRTSAAPVSLSSKLGNRVGVGGRVTAGVLAASVLTFIVTAVPLSMARSEVVRREALSRAATVARAVGVENGSALATGQTLAVGVQMALIEPGVREALVLDPTGRILAPVERMGETIQRIEPFGELSQLQGLLTAEVGGEIQSVSAIESGGRALGYVWIRLDPSYARSGAPMALYLISALLCGLAGAVGVAVMVRRMLVSRLATFATDIDLAASGQLEVVTEPFGMPRLAESVNFIIGRLRLAPQPMAPPPVDYSAAPDLSFPPPSVEREGRLVLDPAYVVQEVTTGAVQLLRMTAGNLVGRHVLEAVTDQGLVNAIIDGIGDLGTQGTATRRVEIGGAPALELKARRETDGAIHVTIHQVG